MAIKYSWARFWNSETQHDWKHVKQNAIEIGKTEHKLHKDQERINFDFKN